MSVQESTHAGEWLNRFKKSTHGKNYSNQSNIKYCVCCAGNEFCNKKWFSSTRLKQKILLFIKTSVRYTKHRPLCRRRAYNSAESETLKRGTLSGKCGNTPVLFFSHWSLYCFTSTLVKLLSAEWHMPPSPHLCLLLPFSSLVTSN